MTKRNCPICLEEVDIRYKSWWNTETFFSYAHQLDTHTPCMEQYLDWDQEIIKRGPKNWTESERALQRHMAEHWKQLSKGKGDLCTNCGIPIAEHPAVDECGSPS